jgi:hypothetical protein
MKLTGLLKKTVKNSFLPVAWAYEKLLSNTPSSPPEFRLFIGELHKKGVFARLQMQTLRVEGVSKSAIVTLDPKRNYAAIRVCRTASNATATSCQSLLRLLTTNWQTR